MNFPEELYWPCQGLWAQFSFLFSRIHIPSFLHIIVPLEFDNRAVVLPSLKTFSPDRAWPITDAIPHAGFLPISVFSKEKRLLIPQSRVKYFVDFWTLINVWETNGQPSLFVLVVFHFCVQFVWCFVPLTRNESYKGKNEYAGLEFFIK